MFKKGLVFRYISWVDWQTSYGGWCYNQRQKYGYGLFDLVEYGIGGTLLFVIDRFVEMLSR